MEQVFRSTVTRWPFQFPSMLSVGAEEPGNRFTECKSIAELNEALYKAGVPEGCAASFRGWWWGSLL